MSFNEEEDVNIYINYGLSEGFGLVKRSSNLGMDGKLKNFTLACLRA